MVLESLYSVVLCQRSCPVFRSRDLGGPMAVHTWDRGDPLPLLTQHDSTDQFSPYDCVIVKAIIIMATQIATR